MLCHIQTFESVDEILKYDQFERKISSATFLWCFLSGVQGGFISACVLHANFVRHGISAGVGFFFFFFLGGGGGGGLWKISPKVEQRMMGIGGGGIKKCLLKIRCFHFQFKRELMGKFFSYNKQLNGRFLWSIPLYTRKW